MTTPFAFESPVIAHSIAIAWLVGYGVVTAPGVVAVCADAWPGCKIAQTAATTAANDTKRVIPPG